ncbi:TadE/TadG family type IV pilus assembly protein [Parvibaculum sp.]|uniref:TadE/TadG family type IV pilus assembly protein n=1 Tax=Parvibaculum sp. TaxID=2024848 RepID=UPI003BA94DBC
MRRCAGSHGKCEGLGTAPPQGGAVAPSHFLGDKRGSVAIEFAFVAAVFLTILFAIMSYGFQFATRIALSYAVTEGGRAAVAGLDANQRELYATNAINNALNAYAPVVDPASATLDFEETADAGGNRLSIGIDYTDSRFSFLPFIPTPEETIRVETTFVVTDPSA